jgi:tetratricopeptide (TPR) repeat protein
LDVTLAGIVVVLAFLIASFAARNSDLLMSMATGRALLDGTYKFGVDPFSYTTEGVFWVNDSWLYDVAVFLTYSAASGTGLVVMKAILTTLLAVVLLAMRRSGQSLWIPAVCTALAILVVSQRLFVQSIVVSYLFLGLTLWLLQKPAAADTGSKRRAPSPASNRRLWLLPVLFLFWVNLDAWFLLGPLTVALYFAGELLQDALRPVTAGPDRRDVSDNRRLGLVLLAGIAACVINPHHIHAFQLPAQLTDVGAAGVLQHDRRFETFFLGAIDYYKGGDGWSVDGIAYLVLLGLSGLSFVANHRDWRGWRILVWAVFAALGIYHARSIPFFAIVAGPITALNLQDAVVRYYGLAPRTSPGWRQWSIGGRVATVVVGILLLLLAWPGWLHATLSRGDARGRHVAWHVELNPGLVKAAEQIHDWHARNVLTPSDHGLNFAIDLAAYCAWYAPEEKTFIDGRMALFEKAAADYVAAQKALVIEPGTDQNLRAKLEPLEQVLRRRGINHLVFYYPDLSAFPETLEHLQNYYYKHYTLVYRNGRVAIFSWDDPDKPGQVTALTREKVDDNRLAFGPQAEPIPQDRPRAPQPQSWVERYLQGREPHPLASDEAGMDLQYFHVVLPQYKQRGLDGFLNAQAAGLAMSGCLAPVPGEPLFRAVVTDTCFESAKPALLGPRAQKSRPRGVPNLALSALNTYLQLQSPGPIAPPLLAVRACRRALTESPDDPDTYFRLQRAYAVLTQDTKEREFVVRLPLLGSVRQAQRIAALNHVVLLDPDHEPAHHELASMYQGLGYMDLALKHLTERVRIMRERGPIRNERPEDYDKALKQLETNVDSLDTMVKRSQNDYEVGQVGRTSLRQKAELALSKGLGGQARDMLLQSEEVKIEPDAVPLELNLMIMTGAIEGETGIRIGLDNIREQTEQLGKKPTWRFGEDRFTLPLYEWLRVMVGAASGDYREADQFLEPIIELRKQVRQEAAESARRAMRNLTPHTLAASLAQVHPTPMLIYRHYERYFLLQKLQDLQAIIDAPPQVADVYALRGILALEAGNNAHAAAQFRKVLELKDATLTPLAKYYLDLLEKYGAN